MRYRTLAIAVSLSFALGHQSQAFAPQKGLDLKAITTATHSVRGHRATAWAPPKSQLAVAAIAKLPGWHAQWDRDTDVPLRAWGPSIAAPGTIRDAQAAETFARQFLAQHGDLFAPGAQASDWKLVANALDPNDHRTVAFQQLAHGLPIVGASVALELSHDHLIMVSSTALPNVTAKLPGGPLAAQTLEASAAAWLATAGYDVQTRAHGERALLALVRPRGNAAAPEIEYRAVETVSVEATRGAGRWDVWLDAFDGRPVARRSTLMFAAGTIQFNVPDQSPTGTRGPKAAPFATHTVNGTQITADINGTLHWTTTSPATVVPGLVGTYATIINQAGSLVSTQLTLADGGSAVWDASSNDQTDAQLDAYVFENTAKHFVLSVLNPNLTWAKGQIQVNVNENMTCNAYSTGDDIHFFQKDTQCENTGRVADVVYHETGHSVHYNSIIQGEGQFDGSLSEGLADTLAVSITGDSGLGRGFFFNDSPLRELNPTVKKKWPQDADGEPHDEGEIIGETLWDLRTALQTKLGTGPGFTQFLKIYYGVMQKSADIPSTYAAAIATDDDNGDLSDGTPNECQIDAAFGAHGLADPATALGLAPPTRDNFTISFTATPPQNSGCGTVPQTVTAASLDWNPRGATGGTLALSATGTTWAAQIPAQPDGTTVEYSVTITLSDGTMIQYPENPADTKYQFFVGTPTVIKCWDFENGADGWTHTGSPSKGDEWAVGAPLGMGGDPKSAHGGTNVLGIDLGADDGKYQPDTTQAATSPEIDLGAARNVHLQYWRWLGVEDGAYDHATIKANGTPVWANKITPGQPMGSMEVNHTDKEWRFQDVDVSAAAASGKMQIELGLDSDPGLEFSGWTVDDVCLVALAGPAPNICGNGVVDTGEECDDGAQNGATGDACSATCTMVDTTTGKKDGGGCCSTSGNPAGSLLLALGTLGLIRRRRRSCSL